MGKLAKELSKIGDFSSEGLIKPIYTKYKLENGTDVQYTDKDGREIARKLFIEQNSRAKNRSKRTSFSGGQSHKCMREQIIDIRFGDRSPKEVDSRLIDIFEDGIWRNMKWIVIFQRMGILKDYEKTSYDPDTNLSWTPDARVDLSEHYGEEYSDVPVEVKGINMHEFASFRARTGKGRFAPSRIMQVHAYMLAENVDSWVIWAENKNNQDIEEYVVKRDKNVIKYLRKRYAYMRRALKTKKLPAIECGMNDSDSKYNNCSRSAECTEFMKNNKRTMQPLKNRVEMEEKASESFV